MNLSPLKLFTRCPSSLNLRRFLEGGFGDRRSFKIARHVDRCLSCQRQLDELTSHDPSMFGNIRDGSHRQPSLLNLIQRLQPISSTYSSPRITPETAADVPIRLEPAVMTSRKNRRTVLIGSAALVVMATTIAGLVYANRVVSRQAKSYRNQRDVLLDTVGNVVSESGGSLDRISRSSPDAMQMRALTTAIKGLDQVATLPAASPSLQLKAELLFRQGILAYRSGDLKTALSCLNQCTQQIDGMKTNSRISSAESDQQRKQLSLLRRRVDLCRALVGLKQGEVEKAIAEMDLQLRAVEMSSVRDPEELWYLDELARGCVDLGRQLDDFRAAERYLFWALDLANNLTANRNGVPQISTDAPPRSYSWIAAQRVQVTALSVLTEKKWDLAHVDAPKYDYLLHQHLLTVAPYDKTLESFDRSLRQSDGRDRYHAAPADYWNKALDFLHQSDLSKQSNRRDLAVCHEMLAQLKRQQSDFKQAKNAYQNALEIRSKLELQRPADASEFQALIETRLQLATVLRLLADSNYKSEVRKIERDVQRWFSANRSADSSEALQRWNLRVSYTTRLLANKKNSGDNGKNVAESGGY